MQTSGLFPGQHLTTNAGRRPSTVRQLQRSTPPAVQPRRPARQFTTPPQGDAFGALQQLATNALRKK